SALRRERAGHHRGRGHPRCVAHRAVPEAHPAPRARHPGRRGARSQGRGVDGMSVAASLSYFSRTALNGIWRSPFVHVIAVASLAIALVGYGLARMASTQLDRLLYALGGEVEMTVYLSDGATPEKIGDLQSALAQR